MHSMDAGSETLSTKFYFGWGLLFSTPDYQLKTSVLDQINNSTLYFT